LRNLEVELCCVFLPGLKSLGFFCWFKKDFAMWSYEEEAWKSGYQKVAGVDEAGRGPLAGPVVAAVCRLPRGFDGTGIDDSKKLSEKKREALFKRLEEDPRVCFGIGIVGPDRIDELNILQATIRAMLDAAAQVEQDYLLVDGLALALPGQKIIKGDQKSVSIAAASVLAKVTRDHIMLEADKCFPGYGFARHKGYGTKAHLEALASLGPCPIHRMSFRPVAECRVLS
jgi:ribonuclease HII